MLPLKEFVSSASTIPDFVRELARSIHCSHSKKIPPVRSIRSSASCLKILVSMSATLRFEQIHTMSIT